MKKPLIPFAMLPAAWGLKGKSREIAQAEYELKGYDLALKLAQINYDNSPEQLKRALLDIDADFGKIDDYEYDNGRIALEHKPDSVEYKLAKLAVELHHKNISQNTHDKEAATLKGEPYVTVLDSVYDPALKLDGLTFEFDWNTRWVEVLVENGYAGMNEEHIVQQWFEDLCQSVTAEKHQDDPVPFNSRRVVQRRPGEGGVTEYR